MFERLPNPLEQPAIDRQPGHYWVRRKWAYGPGRWVVAEWAREADEDYCCWRFCKTSFGDIDCAAIGPRVYEPEPDGGSFGGLISFLISQGFQDAENAKLIDAFAAQVRTAAIEECAQWIRGAKGGWPTGAGDSDEWTLDDVADELLRALAHPTEKE